IPSHPITSFRAWENASAEGTQRGLMRLRQPETAGVEGRRPELGPELLHGCTQVVGEHVLDDADLLVVVERDVDVLVAHEVDRRPLAGGAAHRNTEPSRPRREQEERRRKNRPRALLGIAEEAPGPPAVADAGGGEVAELVGHRLDTRRHEVEEDAALEA